MEKITLNETKICEEYIKGDSALTLEIKYGVSYKTIYRILERNGVKRRADKEKSLNALKQGRSSNSELQRLSAGQRFRSKKNPRWKPVGSTRLSHGYVIVKTRYGWSREHVLIAEKAIGRKLKKWEIVHHINGVKDDNRPNNLYLMTSTQHKALHVIDNIQKNRGLIRINLKSNLNTLN